MPHSPVLVLGPLTLNPLVRAAHLLGCVFRDLSSTHGQFIRRRLWRGSIQPVSYYPSLMSVVSVQTSKDIEVDAIQGLGWARSPLDPTLSPPTYVSVSLLNIYVSC